MSRTGEGLALFVRFVVLDASDPHRSIYLPVVRDGVLESLALFDFADPSLVTGERASTTGPAQALYFMNGPFVSRRAEALADRTCAMEGDDGRDPTTGDFGRQCLLARRFVEAGVRFVELTRGDWDQHRGLKVGHARYARAVDRPIADLLTDLRRRGLLDETLVNWGGEFGRTPHGQNSDGRNHNNKGFSLGLAGGGVKPGIAYGRTDELDYGAVENPMHVHDLHATILHLLGLDHERLTYRYAGRDMRLTDVKGVVHKAILS